ncbi:MAG: hypothetical protein LBH58_09935 [Tannerellaceae bacterium]|nr:hypothetical protein [Tannerellaceae bacterium]
MDNKAKIDYLLFDIKELEKLVAGMRDAEVYPVSFFSQTFDLAHKILNDLHVFEEDQIEVFRKQMEEHLALIKTISPQPQVPPQPVILEVSENEETVEEKPAIAEEPEKEIHEERPVVVPEPPVVESTPVTPPVEKHTVSIHEVLEKQNLSDLRKAFSLNDKFYFRKELFGGDEAKMSKVISDLNNMHSYEESVAYLNEKLNWNIEDSTVTEFLKLLEKRFH